MESLRQVAAGMKELQAAGVVVLLRPFHENAGSWFWWGTGFRLTTRQFVSLWRFTHDFMEKTERPDQPGMAFRARPARHSGDGQLPRGRICRRTRPGRLHEPRRELAGRGRLPEACIDGHRQVCLSEFGPGSPHGGDLGFDEARLVSAIRERMPRTAFFVQWWDGNAGRTGWGMAETRNLSAALNDPWILNRGDISYSGGSQPSPGSGEGGSLWPLPRRVSAAP